LRFPIFNNLGPSFSSWLNDSPQTPTMFSLLWWSGQH
jgi:hypothetical protein